MTHKVTLFKLKSNHKNLRTETIEGETPALPQVGQEFNLTGEGLEFGSRFVRTTAILEMAQVGDSILFKTQNSTYALMIKGAET